ncbi:MAG: hypothetical protein ACOYEF_08770 [Planifilum sp.]
MRDGDMEQMDERMQTDGMIDRATRKTDQAKVELPHVGEERGPTPRMDDGAAEEGEARMEAAEELADPVPAKAADEGEKRRPDAARDEGGGLGTLAIILSVLSLLLLPYILAPAGIVLGIIGSRRNRLGWWAVGVGALSLIINLAAAPYLRLY